jgi:hypothetical protein
VKRRTAKLLQRAPLPVATRVKLSLLRIPYLELRLPGTSKDR